MDTLQAGSQIPICAAVVVCATSPTAADVAAPLRAPGLLDHVLTLRAPAAEDRAALLASALQSKAVLFDHDALEVMSFFFISGWTAFL